MKVLAPTWHIRDASIVPECLGAIEAKVSGNASTEKA